MIEIRNLYSFAYSKCWYESFIKDSLPSLCKLLMIKNPLTFASGSNSIVKYQRNHFIAAYVRILTTICKKERYNRSSTKHLTS